MALTEELERLEQLRRQGALTDAEFAQAKESLLRGLPPLRNVEAETRQWAMFLHLSQLLGFALPLAGWLVPILIWQIKKNELPGLDAHGKNATNWIISELIYAIASALLCFVCIGIPLLIAVGICGIVFPIIAGVQANDGKVWAYPVTMRFFR